MPTESTLTLDAIPARVTDIVTVLRDYALIPDSIFLGGLTGLDVVIVPKAAFDRAFAGTGVTCSRYGKLDLWSRTIGRVCIRADVLYPSDDVATMQVTLPVQDPA